MPSLPAVPRALRVAIVTLTTLCAAAMGAQVAQAAEISGAAFKDVNRDGVKQAAEEPLAGKEIYAFDSSGRPIGHAPTDVTGRYVISNLPTGAYSVRYGTSDWWELWQDWAPTTTGSERPSVSVQLNDTATVDFGWRPIVRSSDVAAPISTYVAADGLRINSYNDVISAEQIHDRLALGSLRGAEAPHTTIRFDYRPSNYCEVSTTRVDGVYGDYRALCHITYLGWLESDAPLFHEYGHAWSLYHASIVQQDPDLRAYLQARGLEGDPRLGSTTEWSPREMIAEDYRQLFGSATAAARPQANTAIPPAIAVAGLREFLAGPFMLPPAQSPPPPAESTPTIHVAGMQASAAKAGRTSWTATATMTVKDSSGQPVAGAIVSVRWSHAKTASSGVVSCTTGATGSCSATATLSSKLDSATLAVASVARDGAVYASDANVSAGPLTVKRPR